MGTGIDPTAVVQRQPRAKRFAANSNLRQSPEHATLLVGMEPRDLAALSELVSVEASLDMVATLTEVTGPVLRRLGAGVVLVPLTFGDSDAVDAAEVLSARGFSGRLVVLCPPLPDPGLVRREIAHAAKGFAVEVVTPRASWRNLA